MNNARHPKAYFALAHEVAHVLQRHETKDLQSMVIDSISAKKDLMNVISTAGSNSAGVIEHVKVGKNLFSRHHSHPNTAERPANLDAIYKEIKLKPRKIN